MTMKKWYKFMIVIILIISIMLICANSAIYAYDYNHQRLYSIITPQLREEINSSASNEVFEVEIMLDSSEICQISSEFCSGYFENEDFCSTIDEVHVFRKKLIETVKSKCFNLNLDFINSLSDDITVVYVSELSPYLIVDVSEKELKNIALRNDFVEKIDLYSNVYIPTSLDYSVNAIRGRTVQNNGVFGYDGSGVHIGMIEGSGYPDSTSESLNGVSIIKYANGAISSHASAVAEVMVSQGADNIGVGVAPGSTLYCTSTISCQFEKCLDWLVDDCLVDVINISMSSLSPNLNTYAVDSAIVDYYSQTFLISIVVASGNDADLGVQGFGMSYNAITVGNLFINSSASVLDDYLHRTSSYYNCINPENGASKPDIVAPGSAIFLNGDYHCGSSIAAPHVTGAIALMGEQDSLVLLSPVVVKSIITAGVYGNYKNFVPSDREVSTSSSYNGMGESYVQYGAGILNCVRNAYIIELENFDFSYIDADDLQDDFIINCEANEKVRVSLVFENNAYLEVIDDVNYYGTEQLNNLDLIIYDSSMNVIASSTTNYNNIEIVEFVPQVSGEYKIQISRVVSDNDTSVRYGYAWIQG